jgi:hypothetical protein
MEPGEPRNGEVVTLTGVAIAVTGPRHGRTVQVRVGGAVGDVFVPLAALDRRPAGSAPAPLAAPADADADQQKALSRPPATKAVAAARSK